MIVKIIAGIVLVFVLIRTWMKDRGEAAALTSVLCGTLSMSIGFFGPLLYLMMGNVDTANIILSIALFCAFGALGYGVMAGVRIAEIIMMIVYLCGCVGCFVYAFTTIDDGVAAIFAGIAIVLGLAFIGLVKVFRSER